MSKKLFTTMFLVLISLHGIAQLADQGIVTSGNYQNSATKLFYEVNGIVSMEAENASYINGWSKASVSFDTNAMQADSAYTWRGGVLRFNINFTKPGKYAVWLLARKGRHSQYGANDIKVWIDRDLSLGPNPKADQRKLLTEGLIDAEGYQSTPDPSKNSEKRESEINFGQTHSFIWMSNPKDGKGPAFWDVKQPGQHHIEFVMGEEYGYAIDKVVLSLDNKYVPEGRGPKETTDPQKDPFAKDEIILPPQWAFGVLYGGYTNQEESLVRVKSIIDHEYPIDAYWIDSWFWDFNGSGRGPIGYMNFTGDTVAFPDVKAMWSEMQKNNVKGGIWIWDIILKDGNERVFKEFEDNKAFERVFLNKVSWHNYGGKSMAGQINFSDPKAVDYFQKRMKSLFDSGLDFFKLDRGPGVPFAKGSFEAIQKYGLESKGRAFIIQHVGDLDNPEYKKYPTKWTGDSEMAWSLPDYPNQTNYTKGGLTENVEMVANPKKYDYDVPFLTHDGGGFRIIGSQDFGEELFIRWIQFSLFSPVTEVFQSLFNSNSNLGWKYSPRADAIFKEHAHLRMRLFPYIYTYAHRTRLYGDRIAKGDGVHKHQYLFGNEILVGPVNEKGATKKKMYFPEGTWINYWTGQTYKGDSEIEVEAPLEKIPLFVRAGAIIPYRDYARSIQLGNNNHLTMEVYPQGSSSFELIEDDGESNDYLQMKIAKTTYESSMESGNFTFKIGKTAGSFDGINSERNYTLNIHLVGTPKSVTIDGKLIKKLDSPQMKKVGWIYDVKMEILTIKTKTKTIEGQTVRVQF